MKHLHGVVSYAETTEPVFTLRATDVVAADAVRFWADRALEAGADPHHIECVRRWADEMDAWRESHGGGRVPHNPMNPAYRQACERDRAAGVTTEAVSDGQ